VTDPFTSGSGAVEQRGANVHGEVLEAGRVQDCYLGLLLSLPPCSYPTLAARVSKTDRLAGLSTRGVRRLASRRFMRLRLPDADRAGYRAGGCFEELNLEPE
jgi:hypothetical protein